jgi:hypothetical protein
MGRAQAAEMVLQQVKVLDKQVAAALALAEQRLDLRERRRIHLPAFWMIGSAPAPRARMNAPIVVRGLHSGVSLSDLLMSVVI